MAKFNIWQLAADFKNGVDSVLDPATDFIFSHYFAWLALIVLAVAWATS